MLKSIKKTIEDNLQEALDNTQVDICDLESFKDGGVEYWESDEWNEQEEHSVRINNAIKFVNDNDFFEFIGCQVFDKKQWDYISNLDDNKELNDYTIKLIGDK